MCSGNNKKKAAANRILYYNIFRARAGFGIKIPLPGKVDFALDYAYMDFGKIAEAVDKFMGNPHRFSIAINF